ncbi:hypothetical protein [Zavarzinella formosa]|uniref:hypothetical protein n=1 Tax=Zavarzinella formosa TaxID=360055 RepID=UPI0012FBEFEA|nr:hypothetical protein [Zavarzinella formosa]
MLGLSAGCGSSEPRLYPLSGKVAMDGAPLAPKPGETAFVELSADAKAGNTSPHLPRGVIGTDGTFTIKTADRSGIEAGAWLARVVYQKEPGAEDKNPYAPPKSLIVKKYSTFDGSGLRVTAGPDSPTAPEFAVSKLR